MRLVEKHIIRREHKEFKKIDHLCWLSKNLYNASLYYIKNYKESTGKWIRYNDLEKKFRLNLNPDYIALPNNSSQQILMVLDKNLKSYFALLSKWKKNPKSLTGCPKFPKYKDKIKGRNIVIFSNGQICINKNGYINLPKKTGLSPIKTKVDGKLKQLRIIPQSSCYVVEVVYEMEVKELIEANDHYLSIDLGLNNLMTCFDSQDSKAIIVSGKPLKSINQFYNKKKGSVQSELKKNHNKYTSNRTKKLDLKRNNKVSDYLHKSSRFIVNYCIESQIQNIVLGYNPEWKQGINIGKRNNQNFVQIPFTNLLSQIKYKAELVGIKVLETEESYTSKCSSLDLEELKYHETYLGKRVKRGLYISKNGTKINADLNGAINILRKVTTNKEQAIVQTLSGRGQVLWPLKVMPS